MTALISLIQKYVHANGCFQHFLKVTNQCVPSITNFALLHVSLV